MRKNLKYKLLGSVFGAVLAITPALATEGMFSNGSGARHRAMAGAGVAHGTDASSIALNPASIANVGNEVTFSVTLFNPDRGASFGGFDVSNHAINYFAIPNMAVNYRINTSFIDSVGLSVSGNGGMNTSYKNNAFLPPNANGATFGIDLQQMLIAVAFAKKFGNVSFGVSPILARQQFTNNVLGTPGYNTTEAVWGTGVRLGLEAEVMPGLRLGGTYSSKIYMSAYDNFKNGIFAVSQGDLDIAANWQIGVSYDITPALTINTDFRYIDYEGVKAIGASFATGGFEWKNTKTFKVGLEYAATENVTLRAGYSYNTQPLKSDGAITAGFLAPGVVQHHITFGFEKENFLTDGLSLEFAGSYAPNKKLTTSNGFATIDMDQTAFTAGLKYKF